jgi:hypothetical protein
VEAGLLLGVADVDDGEGLQPAALLDRELDPLAPVLVEAEQSAVVEPAPA